MPRERGEKVIATNRRARHDYNLEKSYEAGLVLTGTEVKSLREGRANLSDGYAYIDNGEAFLEARVRPAFHDLLDPQGGYTRGAQIDFLDARKMDISSTQIREQIQKGLPFERLVPQAVADYIHEHGLYGAKTGMELNR